jgi:hypothetical protein
MLMMNNKAPTIVNNDWEQRVRSNVCTVQSDRERRKSLFCEQTLLTAKLCSISFKK